MASVEKKQEYAASPDEMWAKIGDFGTPHTWHPALEATELSDDGNTRTLTLVDGGTIIEAKTAEGERTYSYKITESPLPVSGLEGTIAVNPAGDGGSEVVWSSQFEPAGATEEEAVAVVAGIYDAGLGAI